MTDTALECPFVYANGKKCHGRIVDWCLYGGARYDTTRPGVSDPIAVIRDYGAFATTVSVAVLPLPFRDYGLDAAVLLLARHSAERCEPFRLNLQPRLRQRAVRTGHSNALHHAGEWRPSEWVPGRAGREFQIADVDAKPHAHPGADRNDDNAVGVQGREAEPPDKIGRAGDPAKTLKNRVDGGQVVDQHHRPVAVGSCVEPDRRTLPIDLLIAGVARVHLAFAVSKSAHERGGRFLTQDVAVGQTPLADRLLNRLGEPAREGSEKMVPAFDDLVECERRRHVRRSRSSPRHGGKPRANPKQVSAREVRHRSGRIRPRPTKRASCRIVSG